MSVGGRFSVLTPVGLLPIAVSGADVDALMQGAADARSEYTDADLAKNEAYQYAALRNICIAKVTQLRSWKTTNLPYNTSLNGGSN